MNHHEQFGKMLAGEEPILALAPMQDVTDLPFWKLMTAYGGADVYYTEFFRVHAVSNLEKYILKSITENPTERVMVAAPIGNDIPSLVRTMAQELQEYNIAAVDLNLGCPAPIVYRKYALVGDCCGIPWRMLRDPGGATGLAVKVKFTVKTRLGFDSPEVFDQLLPIFAEAFAGLVNGAWTDGEGDVLERGTLPT